MKKSFKSNELIIHLIWLNYYKLFYVIKIIIIKIINQIFTDKKFFFSFLYNLYNTVYAPVIKSYHNYAIKCNNERDI